MSVFQEESPQAATRGHINKSTSDFMYKSTREQGETCSSIEEGCHYLGIPIPPIPILPDGKWVRFGEGRSSKADYAVSSLTC